MDRNAYRCPDCGKEFDSADRLEEHTHKEHRSEAMRAGQRQSREGNSQRGPQRVRPSDREA